MKRFGTKDMVYLFFTIFILIQSFFFLFSESTLGFGGRANIYYYQTARYLVANPELRESPLFIAMLIPFAQLGYSFARAFNLLVAVVTLILLVKIVKRLYNEKFSLLVVALTAFSPVYFNMATSSFPEILLGFLLIASVYLFISERYILSSFVVSLIPLVIPAGIFILPVFALVFYLQKSYKAIPLLISGIFIHSVGALIVYEDFLLLFHSLRAGVGSTAWNMTAVPVSSVGIVFIVLTFSGLSLCLYETVKRGKSHNIKGAYFIVIAGTLLVYCSVSCWWLTESQPELERATAAIIPLMALISLKTIDFIQRIMKSKELATGGLIVLVATHVLLLFIQPNLFRNAAPGELAMKKAASYLRYNEQGSQVFCSDPLLAHFLDLKPESSQLTRFIPENGPSSENMDWGDILVWSSGQGNDSVEILTSELHNDSNLTRLISFNSSNVSSEVNGRDNKVHLFKKEQANVSGSEVADYYQSVLNFDDYLDNRVQDIGGIKVWELDSTQEYSPAIRIKTGVVQKKNFYEITATVNYKVLGQINTAEVLLVCSVEENGKSMNYNAEYIVGNSEEWEEQELKVTTPATVPKTANIAVYLWNKERKQMLIEELSVAVKSY